MDRQAFLLKMLAGIFIAQVVVLGYGITWCARNGGLKTCPDVTKTYEQTFNVAIATTLALLTGTALKN